MDKKPNFLNDLEAKLAAGPPKRPVGLVKPTGPAVADGKKLYEQSKDVQKKLSEIVKGNPQPEATS